MPRVRDFQPENLHGYASSKLQVNWRPHKGFEGRVWQFLILLPRWYITTQARTMICTAADEALLEDLLEQHFGGYKIGPSYQRGIRPGVGQEIPQEPARSPCPRARRGSAGANHGSGG